MPSTSPAALRGREAVANGELKQLRERLGMTRTAMAEMLHTSVYTYTSWERRGAEVRLWPSTAERIGRFVTSAQQVLDELGEDLVELIPFYVAATYSGIPQEILLRWYREGQVPAVDMGILGLWIHKDDLANLAINQDYS